MKTNKNISAIAIMKKKQGYALGSLLLGAASWLCLLGLRHIERRMKKKQEK